MATRFRLNGVRLAFANGLWTRSKPPKAGPDAKEKYRCALIIPRTHIQLPELEKIVKDEMKALFGAKWEAIHKAAGLQKKLCLRDGDNEDYAGYKGNMYLQCSSDIQPTVYGYNPKEGPLAKEQARSIVFSGVWVNASLDIKAFDTVSNGCSAYIRGVQLTVTPPGQSDEALGGGTAASDDDFDEIGVSAAADPLVA